MAKCWNPDIPPDIANMVNKGHRNNNHWVGGNNGSKVDFLPDRTKYRPERVLYGNIGGIGHNCASWAYLRITWHRWANICPDRRINGFKALEYQIIANMPIGVPNKVEICQFGNKYAIWVKIWPNWVNNQKCCPDVHIGGGIYNYATLG